MGMLQLLLKVYDRLDPALGKDTYAMKLKIISNNLFGVDIEPMAVEISRLRAWLSLVVDLEVETKKVKPLPNLDFRFVCANSLIPLDQSDAMMFGEDPELSLKLEEIRRHYFTTESLAKKKKHRTAYEKLKWGNCFNNECNGLPHKIFSIVRFYDLLSLQGTHCGDVFCSLLQYSCAPRY